ncbi:RNA 2',3'-cyclic phosphodiesterase [Shewanella sp. A3A]|nr:RNA 2',3'-cyclic phosphodiesterase [Shewanella ferrihydritica]
MTNENTWPKRCFLGFALSEPQRQQLCSWQQQLGEGNHRWVASANLHLTLAFLGQLQPTQMQQLLERVQLLSLQRFSQPLTQLAYWPKPNIACMTSEHVATALQLMAAEAQQLMQQLALPASEHSVYRPHITLARKANSLTNSWETLVPVQLNLQPTALHLYHSQSSETGVRYQILKSWPLV